MIATAFISDLHLSSTQPKIIALFLQFLKEYTKQLDALYILGDFFEVWIGDDVLTETDLIIIQALKQATEAGLPIYFMAGNRDFLIGKKFLKATGLIYLKDPYVINLYHNKILLMHGDTLCTQDIAYQKFRRKTRNWLIQKIFLLKSSETRQALANRYRMQSQAHTATTALNIMDVTPSEVIRVMKKYHVTTLIHGHTHRPATHTFLLNGHSAKRFVLPAWHEEGGALMFFPNGQQKWVAIRANS